MTVAAIPAPRLALRRLVLRTALLGGIAVAGFGAGFAWFVHASLRPGPPPPHADGIVALTGGADRVETALHLLLAGRARRLLVSGVAPAPNSPTWHAALRLDPARVAGQVTLGHQATSTMGNATETAAWVQAHRIRTLIVVTAGYHMQRALLEIGRALPGDPLYPEPVLPPAMRGPLDLSTTKLLANEYDKLLAVRLGLTRFARAGEAN